jgi:thioredoxin 1
MLYALHSFYCIFSLFSVSFVTSFSGYHSVNRPIQKKRRTTIGVSLSSTAIQHDDIAELCDENLERFLLESKKPVLIDIYAKWCGPCKLIEPVVGRCKEKWEKAINILKFDVESKNLKVKMEFLKNKILVNKLPCLILYNDGKLVSTHSGLVNDDQLEKYLQEFHAIPNSEVEVGEQHQQETSPNNKSKNSSAGFINLSAM